MFCKIVFRSKAMNRVLKPAKGLTAFSPMIYWRTARFGILEDKLKEIKKEAFSRIKIAKGRPEQVEEENKFVVDRLKLFGDSSSKMHEFSISGMTLDEVVTRLKTALEAKEKSYDLYYNIIDRINQVVIDEPEKTGKDEVLKILRVLCYYRPKDEEKFIREAKYKGYVSKDQDFLSQKHLEKIKNNLDQFATPVGHAINYIEKGLKRNYLRDILIDYTESMDKTMSKSIYDIIERYRILFINLELFVQEHLNRKNIDHREAIDVLVSFSIAGEGSNLLYERIAEQIEPALKESKYTLHDIELIVNYIPLELWEHTKIHEIIPKMIVNEIEKLTVKESLSFFQAFSTAPKIPKDFFNKLMNKLINEIEKDKMSKADIFNFLEIYAIMLTTVKSKGSIFDSKLLMSLISKHIYKKYLAKSYEFSLNDVAELYWVYGVLEIFEDSENKEIVKPLESILNDVLAEYITKYKPLTEAEMYDGLKQELEFDEKDIDAIRFYYDKYNDQGCLTNYSKIIKLIDSIKKKYDDRPEGERKWFVI